MKRWWPTLRKSLKKVTGWWVPTVSLILAFWPLPGDWNASISINLRLIFAIIILVAIVIAVLVDLLIYVYNGTMLDERVTKVTSEKLDGNTKYVVWIGYNPWYKSMTVATVYYVEKESGIDPLSLRVCNGRVIAVRDNEMIQIICEISDSDPHSDDIASKLNDWQVLNNQQKTALIVRPYYEGEDYRE